MAKRAAIIGGGITGLALAYFLLKKGIKPTVFEKEDHLGGLASTFKLEDARLEKFYHHFFVRDQAAFDLIEELGLKEKFFWYFPKMGFYSEGKTYPFTSALDLLKFSHLSLIDRIKFGWFTLKLKRMKNWRPLENITARDWLTAQLGYNVYKKFWRPMLKGKFGSLADQVPASFIWFRLKAREQSRAKFGTREKLGYLKGSFDVLFTALTERIKKLGGEIKLNCGSTALPVQGFDFTIVTTPNAYSIPTIDYLGNICVVFKFKTNFNEYYWTSVGEEEMPFCALVEHTNAVKEAGYNGFNLLYASSYLEHHHLYWGLSDKEIYDEYVKGLKKIKPNFLESDIAEYYVWRAKFAQPVPTLGHSKKIPPFKINEKLYYVTNAQIYPEDRGVSDSIKLAWNFVNQLS